MTDSILRRTAVLTLAWWAMSEGVIYALPVALTGIALAVAVSVVVAPPAGQRVNWIAMARFVPFFIARSAAGGLDVSRRALHPALPIAPGFVSLPLSIAEGAARSLFVSVVGLLPGTLSVMVDRDELTVHVIDTTRDALGDLRELEEMIARIFRERSSG